VNSFSHACRFRCRLRRVEAYRSVPPRRAREYLRIVAKHPSPFLTALVVLAALEVAPATTGAQTPPGIEELLARVGERIADFYKRAQHVICFEKSTVQPIDLSRSNQGFARIVESEMRVEADGLEEARVFRDV